MTEGSPDTDRSWIRDFAWLLVPVTIFIGDIEIRWVREFGNVIVAFPGLLASSILASVVAWGSFTTLVAGRRQRNIVIVLAVGIISLMMMASWGSMHVRHFAITPGDFLYLLEEPGNAVGMLAAVWSWQLTLVWIAVTGTWSLAIGISAQRPRSTVQRWIAGAGLLGFLGYIAFLPSMFANPWTPYLNDVRSAYVVTRGLADRISGERSFRTGYATRDSVPSVEDRSGPNVLLIIGESMRPDHMSVVSEYERETTPRLAAFVSEHPDETYLFERHVPSSAATFWAISSLFTGKYPLDGRAAFRTQPAIWQYADAAGYDTFIASSQSWDWAQLRQVWLDPGPDHFADAVTMDLDVVNDTGSDDLPTAEKIASWLSTGEIEAPFLGVVQLNATHWPFIAKPGVPWSVDDERGLFDAATARSDQAIGVLIDALEARGLLDDTVIVVTSDHAEMLGGNFTDSDREDIERREPALLHGARVGSCEPVFVNAPLIVYIPEKWRERAGASPETLRTNTQRVTSHTDVLPTVLSLLDIPTPAGLDGRDLLTPVDGDRIALCTTAPGWTRNEMTGLGARKGDLYIYARGNLGESYAFDLSKPGAASRRFLPSNFPSSASDLIGTLHDDERLHPILERATRPRE